MKANTRKYWLKMVGAADKEVADHWIEAHPKLLTEIRFPQRPSGIRRGDYLVYYSAGSQKLFSIVRAKGNGSETAAVGAAGEGRWPYLLEVQTLLAVPQLALSPHWSVLDLPSTTVQQKSHVEISLEKYRLAHAAMISRSAA
ncbi:MAG TPA: hypothetical protein VNC15_09645 [Solirubrobacterales bacterium]|jgi:hypothetical protein|nr:hypothetical protein [Solirubrobacterales bacterium]